MGLRCFLVHALLLTLCGCSSLQVASAAASSSKDIPDISSCNFCFKCIVDGEPPVPQLSLAADAAADPGGPPDLGALLQPPDLEQKALLPNCTLCRGCNAELKDISESDVSFKHVRFQHGKGATNSRLFFAQVPGSSSRTIVKVFCVPFSKLATSKRPPVCSVKQASQRVELLLAQQRLLGDCGMQEITPRVWVAKVNAIIPRVGFHVHWHGLWMEEARGITLHGLYISRDQRLALNLLQQKLNRTQVQLAAIWDLLTAQCDRHSENIFVDEEGNIDLIDNDKALGVVPKCGYDTMLLPGTRYHSVLRIGFWRHIADYYRRQRLTDPKMCHGIVDARFVIDYRCTTADGKLGTSYPPSVEQCLRRLSGMNATGVMERYGLTVLARAEMLQSRASDMINNGFEWTMENGLPLNGPRFKLPHQPACCGLIMSQRMLMCQTCWQPLLPEDFSNSTDLALVTSLVDRRARPAQTIS